jgi:hypothetical protein
MNISYGELVYTKHFAKRCRQRQISLSRKELMKAFYIGEKGEGILIGTKRTNRLTNVYVICDNVIVTAYVRETKRLKGAC